MKSLLSVFILLLSLSSIAQNNYQLGNQLEFFRNNQIANGQTKSTLTAADIKGSPYLNDEFIRANVFTTSKTQFPDIPLRLNIYNNEIEFKNQEGNIAAIATPEIIEKITTDDYVLVYVPYSFAKRVNRGFFKLIVDGEVKLYARPNVEFKEAVPPAPYKEAESAQFIQKADSYYLRFGTEAAQLIANKKDLETLFPDHKKEVAAFIKKHKINHRKEDKLKELVVYYNSL